MHLIQGGIAIISVIFIVDELFLIDLIVIGCATECLRINLNL